MFKKKLSPDIEVQILLPHHADALYELTQLNIVSLSRWLPFWPQLVGSPKEAQDYIERQLSLMGLGHAFFTGIWIDNHLAGIAGLNAIDNENASASLGYWLGETYRGRGAVTSTCKALIDYAFDDAALERIEVAVADGNETSIRVAQRLGAVLEGRKRHAERIDGMFTDHLVFSVLRAEWQNQPSLTTPQNET